MLRKLWRKIAERKGFTLIEVMVALAIAGLIGTGVTTTIFQILSINASSQNHVLAVKQVENAATWLNNDVRMAQIIEPGGVSGFPLDLTWVEWDNTTHQVSYTISNGELQRSSSTNGTQPMQIVVGQYIDDNADNTNCQYSNGVFNFKVTASSGGFRRASETRMAQVIPRSAQ